MGITQLLLRLIHIWHACINGRMDYGYNSTAAEVNTRLACMYHDIVVLCISYSCIAYDMQQAMLVGNELNRSQTWKLLCLPVCLLVCRLAVSRSHKPGQCYCRMEHILHKHGHHR